MAFINGFLLGMSLILAVGAQNAFVLRVGLAGHHVFAVSLFCAVSDALLIVVGISGVGTLLSSVGGIAVWLYLGAAAWIGGYGILRLRGAVKGDESLRMAGRISAKIGRLLAAAAGLTWLNPHVYLDTVVLIGGISATLEPAERALFGIGAALASFVFFFSLGYGARALSGKLKSPTVWRWIDLGLALVMFWLAGGLIWAALSA